MAPNFSKMPEQEELDELLVGSIEAKSERLSAGPLPGTCLR